jgi:outer membrane protein assembly factor BamB
MRLRFIAIAVAIATVLMAAICSAQPASSTWPMFHHDLRHTGLSTVDTSANPGQLKWTFGPTFQTNAAQPVFSSPSIGVDGTIYIGINDALYALNPDGSEKWAFETGLTVTSSPAIAADGTIYSVAAALLDQRTISKQRANGYKSSLTFTDRPDEVV